MPLLNSPISINKLPWHNRSISRIWFSRKLLWENRERGILRPTRMKLIILSIVVVVALMNIRESYGTPMRVLVPSTSDFQSYSSESSKRAAAASSEQSQMTSTSNSPAGLSQMSESSYHKSQQEEAEQSNEQSTSMSTYMGAPGPVVIMA